jgi:hypothetical protein
MSELATLSHTCVTREGRGRMLLCAWSHCHYPGIAQGSRRQQPIL